MSNVPLERVLVEADVDHGVTTRILDFLCAVDRFPRRLRMDCDNRVLTLDVEFENIPSCRVPVVARIRQISGVRGVVRFEPPVS